MNPLGTLEGDTIAAVATATGRGGVGIIRLSGPLARIIGEQICRRTLRERYAHFCEFHDTTGTVIDSGIAIFYAGPRSFTGEDVVELHAHGGPVILDVLLRESCTAGARTARPGEFSERAFLNDKLDLTQAEAIADLINSTTEESARSASRSLQGAFSREIDALVDSVTQLRVYVEAAIDFPEEEIDFLADGSVALRLQEVETRLRSVIERAHQGSLLREGMKLVIAGRPNAGKSSLLNALSGQDSAIVTPIEGTTRDVLREQIQIDGLPLHIVDTAGLRDSRDAVEQEGIRRAWQEMATADRILLVVDASTADASLSSGSLWPEKVQRLGAQMPVTVIHNKVDLCGRAPGIREQDHETCVALSALTGEGIDLLREHLKECIGFREGGTDNFSARRRHLEALGEANRYLAAGRLQLTQAGAGELLAEDLRQCHNALGRITGAMSSDELLGEIFSSFCIGK